jgi:hypothetical protein
LRDSYDDLVQYKGEQIGQTILPDINLIGNSVMIQDALKDIWLSNDFRLVSSFIREPRFPPTLSEIHEMLF